MTEEPKRDRGPYQRRRKQIRILKEQNPDYKPRAPMAPELRAHLDELARYLSSYEIARRANVPFGTTHAQVTGVNDSIMWETAQALASVRLTAADKVTSADRLRGAQRIIQGLMARGWTYLHIAETMGVTKSMIMVIGAGGSPRYKGMSVEKYSDLLNVAQKLETADPVEAGVNPARVNNNVTRARNRGYAPLGAWDLDDIHLEDARPDWTGRCGTVQGYLYHLREEIGVHIHKRPTDGRVIRKVLCQPCVQAYGGYKSEHGPGKRGMGELTAAAVREYQGMHPNASANEVAAALDVSARTVVRVRSADRKKKEKSSDDVSGD